MIRIDVSLLKKLKYLKATFDGRNKKKIINDSNDKEIKKIRINKPLEGSLAKVWTEFNIPDRTKKVPVILNVKVIIAKIIVHEWKEALFSRIIIECNKAVEANHGRSEAFSTGSQNQKPPQPSS